MSEIMIPERLDMIASEIGFIKQQVKTVVLQSAVEIGRRLSEAKELCPHGRWGEYISTLEFSERTAQNMMRLYGEYNENSNAKTLADLTYTKALALLGLPRAEREQFAEENDIAELSTRELTEKVAQLNAERDALSEQVEQLSLDIQTAETDDGELEQVQQQLKQAQADAEKARIEAKAAKHASEVAKAAIQKAKTEAETARADATAAQEAAKNMKPETVVVSEVPPDIEKELHMLREKAKKAPCESVIRFRTDYEALKAAFDRVADDLIAIDAEMPEDAPRYRSAMRKAAEVFMTRSDGA